MGEGKPSFLDVLSKSTSVKSSLVFNRAYEYKGVKFYSIPIGRLVEFYTCLEVLTVKQERARDKKLVKMPFLWFLIYSCQNHFLYENPSYQRFVPLLYALLEIATQTNNFELKIERKANGDYKKCLLCIDGVEFNYKEFSEIRSIIFEQSGIEHSDEFINEDAEKAIRDSKIHEMKKSGYVQPTLDDLLNKFCVYMKKSKDEVEKEYSIRDFNKFLAEMSMFEDWRVAKTGQMSGMVKFKSPIPHWFSGHEKPNLFKDQEVDYKNSNLMKIGSAN